LAKSRVSSLRARSGERSMACRRSQPSGHWRAGKHGNSDEQHRWATPFSEAKRPADQSTMAGGKKAPNSRRFALFSHSLSHRKSVGFGARLLRGSAAQTPDNQRFRVIVTTAKNPSRGYKTAKKWETKKTTSHGICLGGGIPRDRRRFIKRFPSFRAAAKSKRMRAQAIERLLDCKIMQILHGDIH
jgi:hypothetical protein